MNKERSWTSSFWGQVSRRDIPLQSTVGLHLYSSASTSRSKIIHSSFPPIASVFSIILLSLGADFHCHYRAALNNFTSDERTNSVQVTEESFSSAKWIGKNSLTWSPVVFKALTVCYKPEVRDHIFILFFNSSALKHGPRFVWNWATTRVCFTVKGNFFVDVIFCNLNKPDESVLCVSERKSWICSGPTVEPLVSVVLHVNVNFAQNLSSEDQCGETKGKKKSHVMLGTSGIHKIVLCHPVLI